MRVSKQLKNRRDRAGNELGQFVSDIVDILNQHQKVLENHQDVLVINQSTLQSHNTTIKILSERGADDE